MTKEQQGYCVIIGADNSKIKPSLIPETAGITRYGITTDPYTFLGLADRAKVKDKWWTCRPENLMVFRKKDAAEYSMKRLKYGNPKVVTYKEAVKRITHWFWREQTSTLSQLLAEKETQWTDDDWNEGKNAHY